MHALVLVAVLLAQVVEGQAPSRPLHLDDVEDGLRKQLVQFDIPDRGFTWTLEQKKATRKWIEYELTFPSPVKTDSDENNTVPCKYWVPVDDGKRRPAVVVLHWLGGSFDVLDVVCQRLAEEGIATLMPYMPGYGKRKAKDAAKRIKMVSPDTPRTIAAFRQAVMDIRRAGDWLASRPDVEPARIGIMGISLGAVVASLASSIDLNFHQVVLLVGGGDLPTVVLNGSKETIDLKKKAEEDGLTYDKMREQWQPIEPLTYASRLDRGAVLMVNAENDQVIPRAATEKLWEAIGKPEILWCKADHYTWVIFLGKILDKTAAHLKVRRPYVSPQPPLLGPPLVRVLLKENADSVAIDIPGASNIRRPGAAQPIEKDVTLGAAIAKGGASVTVGERTWNEPWIVIEPKGRFKVGDRTYEGALHLIVSRAGGVHVVNEVDLERYVAGVVGPEIGAGSPLDALKAQAVCARTYAYVAWLDVAKSASRQIFDVYDDVRDQVYKGVPEGTPNVEKAVAETAGRILTAKEKPFKTFFSSTCGGKTESGGEVFGVDLAPLAGVTCGSCGHAKHFEWTLTMTAEAMGVSLAGLLGDGGVKGVAVTSATKGGRAARVTVTRSDGSEVLIAGAEFRKLIGYDKFRSTKFAVTREGDAFVFSGNGWGHGVGLCQEGAIGMARGGASWEGILAKYYPSATLKSIYDVK